MKRYSEVEKASLVENMGEKRKIQTGFCQRMGFELSGVEQLEPKIGICLPGVLSK
jgi:hypothetical protein